MMSDNNDLGAIAASGTGALAVPVEPASGLAPSGFDRTIAGKCGGRFDPFADVRMGRSLFDMRPQDWIDKSGCQYCDGYCHGGCREGY